MSAPLAERIVAAPRAVALAARRASGSNAAARPGRRSARALAERKASRALLLGLADHSPYLWSLIDEDPARLARLLAATARRLARRVDRERRGAPLRRRGDADARAAPRQARGRAADRARRHRRRLGRRRGDRGADALRRRRGRGGAALSAAARGARGPAERSIPRPPTSRRAAASSCSRSASTARASSTIPATSTSSCSTTRRRRRSPTGVAPAPLFVRIVKALARLLQERTPDGYVLRVDLRLRPDPGATPIALSIASAASYYETLGQNWERAAMIKARPVAGDLALGRSASSRELAPFIWRKYFDYAAIADIHAMKRQIHAVRGHEQRHRARPRRQARPRRHPRDRVLRPDAAAHLRRPAPVAARLAHARHAARAARRGLGDAPRRSTNSRRAYVFLRRVEHRLQMVADEQTQRLPLEADALARFAQFCGYARARRASPRS